MIYRYIDTQVTKYRGKREREREGERGRAKESIWFYKISKDKF